MYTVPISDEDLVEQGLALYDAIVTQGNGDLGSEWILNGLSACAYYDRSVVAGQGQIPISVVYQRKGFIEMGLTDDPQRMRSAALLADSMKDDIMCNE